MLSDNKLRGALAVAAGASVWGLFWIPLRYLDDNGVQGLWSVASLLLVPVIFIVPYLLWKKRLTFTPWYCLFGLTIGTSVAIYFAAMIFSDVIRIIFLFYLLPVWATLLSWLLYRQKIKPLQILAIGMALFGLYLLLGGTEKFPIPSDIGDWFGLGSGFLWALALVMIRGNPDIDPLANTSAPFVFGAPIAIAIALVLSFSGATEASSPPDMTSLLPVAPVAILVGLLILWPSVFGQIWGARLISAPTAALVTMSEIVMATVSAWLLIGTTLSPIAWLGGGLIILAAVLDLTQSPA